MKKAMKERAVKLNDILETRGSEIKVEAVEVFKNNNPLCGFVLKKSTNNCAPTLYYSEDWYAKEDDELVDFLIDFFEEHSIKIEVPNVTREFVESKIMPKLLGAHNIPAMDEHNIVHWGIPYTDLTVAFYIPMEEMSNEDGIASATVNYSMLALTGMTEDECYSAAMKNFAKVATVQGISEITADMLGLEPEDLRGDKEQMYVVSRDNKMFGSAAILCTSIMKEVKDRLGTDQLVILPSSVHECIVIDGSNGDDNMLIQMVSEVNDEQVDEVDRLTYNAYRYIDGQIVPMA